MYFSIIFLILIPLIAFKVYQKIRVPKGLKNIPTLSSIKYYVETITKVIPEKRWEEIRDPMEKEGIGKVWVNGRWVVVITDLGFTKELLTKTDLYPKFPVGELSKSLFSRHYGESVSFTIGDVWKRHRRVMNPAFRHLPLQPFIESGIKMLQVMEKADNEPIEVKELMDRLTMDVLGKVSYGLDFNNLEEPNNVYVTTYKEAIREVNNPLYFIFPILDKLLPRTEGRKKVVKLNKLYEQIIENKLKLLKTGELSEKINNNTADLLDLMVFASNDPENPALTSEELRANVAIFMLAGHDTTSNALSSILYLLAIHKDVQQKVRDEILQVLGDDLTPSMEQQKKLRYMDMVIKENLRIFPPVTRLPVRNPLEDVKFRNHVIPAHTPIELNIYGIHYTSKNWTNPEKFIPERFDNEKYEHFSWLSFGAGNRACIGSNFSLIEQRLILSILLRKYEVSLPADSIHKDKLQIGSTNSGTMGPSPNLYLKFKRRTE